MEIPIASSTIDTIGLNVSDILGSFSGIITLIFGILLAFWVLSMVISIFSQGVGVSKKTGRGQSVVYGGGISPTDIFNDYNNFYQQLKQDFSATQYIQKNISRDFTYQFFRSRGLGYFEAKKMTSRIYSARGVKERAELIKDDTIPKM